MKHYSLATTGQRLTTEEAERIIAHNREILNLPAKEFIARVHELTFMAVTEE